MQWLIWVLFSPRGRIGRLAFNVYAASIAGLYVVICAALAGAFALSPQDWAPGAPTRERAEHWLAALCLPVAWTAFAVGAKRLHDFNWSAFWQAPPILLQQASPWALVWIAALVPEPAGLDPQHIIDRQLTIARIQDWLPHIFQAAALGLFALLALRPGNPAGLRHASGPEGDDLMRATASDADSHAEQTAPGWPDMEWPASRRIAEARPTLLARPPAFGRRRAAA